MLYLAFIAFVLFMLFGLMNILTAVILDATMDAVKKDIKNQFLRPRYNKKAIETDERQAKDLDAMLDTFASMQHIHSSDNSVQAPFDADFVEEASARCREALKKNFDQGAYFGMCEWYIILIFGTVRL